MENTLVVKMAKKLDEYMKETGATLEQISMATAIPLERLRDFQLKGNGGPIRILDISKIQALVEKNIPQMLVLLEEEKSRQNVTPDYYGPFEDALSIAVEENLSLQMKNSPRFNELYKKYIAAAKALQLALNENDKTIYDKYNDLAMDVSFMQSRFMYLRGFKDAMNALRLMGVFEE
ncbi:DUF6809 family protein [Anaerotruncus rubiinfantis]|uniref:DUF6809 family protein n=1 Tax=Anaerotruncus rubiinfantis TaxID=1720200 RepID=UPI0034A3546F